MKVKTKLVTFFIIFFVGVAFGVVGMFMPPQGVIDGSVLILIGQIFVLAASVYGWEIHFDIQKGRFDAGQAQQDIQDSPEFSGQEEEGR